MPERHKYRRGVKAAEQYRPGRLRAAVRDLHRRNQAKQTVLVCVRDLPVGAHVHLIGAVAVDREGEAVRQWAGGRALGHRAYVRRAAGEVEDHCFPYQLHDGWSTRFRRS